jgi:hypothetical protein
MSDDDRRSDEVIQVLDCDNIRASIDSRRRREAARERKQDDAIDTKGRGPLGID